MTTDNTFAAEVQQRVKALEDWAVTTLGNTTALSSEAGQALRHHGTKGLRGRAFTLTAGRMEAALIVHGRIEGLLISDAEPLRTIILTPANPMFLDGNELMDAVIGYVHDVHACRNTGWVLTTNVSGLDAELTNNDHPTVTLTIE